MSLRAYLPAGLDRWSLYGVIQNACLPLGLSMKAVHSMFKAGGSKQSLHFAWKAREKLLETELIRECVDVMSRIDENPPVYERRIAKSGFKKTIGVLKSPVTIKSIFKELAGNRSSPRAFSEEK